MKTRKSRPMAVYWINLDRSTERRENMLALLKDPVFDGMAKHRVKAYDGGDPTDEKKIRSMISILPLEEKVIMKEYACLLSHLKTILLFSRSDYEYALVLEDDVSLEYKPYWNTTFMECIRGAPRDWEIIQLCINENTLPKQLYSSEHHYSCAAYMICKRGAKKLMQIYHSNYFNLDPTIRPTADEYVYKATKTYVYRYPFFTFANKDTTIFLKTESKELTSRGNRKQTLQHALKTRRFPLKQDILFVTAFKNIHRDQWKVHARSVEEYLNNFMILTKLPYTLVVYVEPEIKKQIPLLPNVIVRDFDEVDTFYDKYLERDKQIMKSEAYQSMVPERRKIHPEHLYSDYNFINHSKINFVSHAKHLYPHYAFYSWVDFGFSGVLKNIPCPIRVSSLPKKVIYQTMNTPISISEEEMLASEDVYFAGSAFIVHHSLVDPFEKKYEQKIKEWQTRGITDDDQNLVLQIYLDDPSFFHTVYHKNWRMLYSLLTPSKKLCK